MPCPFRPALECLEGRSVPAGGYTQVDLASDVPGLARITDPNLVNPWGISSSPTGPFWFADNGAGVSEVLDGRGEPFLLVATVPGSRGLVGTPTGTLFNSGSGFRVSEHGIAAPARFLFATEDGTISGWTSVVDPSRAIAAVDNSSSGAVYKGLATATDTAGQSFLYATDFGRGEVDVFDQEFRPVARPGAFQDPALPEGFAPFGIASIDNLLFVTYARQDARKHDDVPGPSHGFIDVYDTGGELIRRFASRGPLDSPWGLVLAPPDFGRFGGAVLVGNVGDGRINAYDPASGAFLGPLVDGRGVPITIPTLWALSFGNGHEGGDADTLFFTAGVGYEQHGLFGAIQPPQRSGMTTAGPGKFDPHAPGEAADYPLPPRGGPAVASPAGSPTPSAPILLPVADSSLVVVPTLSIRPQPPVPVGNTAPTAPVVDGPSFAGFFATPQTNPVGAPSFSAAGDPPGPQGPHENDLGRSAPLDLSDAQPLPSNPAEGQSPSAGQDTVAVSPLPPASREWSHQASPHPEKAKAPPGAEQESDQPDQAPAPAPTGGAAAKDSPRAGQQIEPRHHGWRSALTSTLLVVLGASLIYARNKSRLARRPSPA